MARDDLNTSDQPTWRRAPDEPISIQPGRLGDVRVRDLFIRFGFGE